MRQRLASLPLDIAKCCLRERWSGAMLWTEEIIPFVLCFFFCCHDDTKNMYNNVLHTKYTLYSLLYNMRETIKKIIFRFGSGHMQEKRGQRKKGEPFCHRYLFAAIFCCCHRTENWIKNRNNKLQGNLGECD